MPIPTKLECDQPETLEEAIDFIYDSLTSEEKKNFKDNGGLSKLHASLGLNLRNAWNLWGSQPDKPTTLKDHFREVYSLGHADDMSGMILGGVDDKLNQKETDPVRRAAGFKAHWTKMGIDPISTEGQ